jgi:hypothetical protein
MSPDETSMTLTKKRGLLVGAVSVLAASAVIVVIAASSCACRHSDPLTRLTSGDQIASNPVRPVAAKRGPSPTPRRVPCALTHDAGGNGTSSCWATHTGVQAGTGYSQAQIEAGAPGFTHVNGPVTITQPGTVIDHEWINGCIAINSGANNVTIKSSLITNEGDCQSNVGDTYRSAINAGQDSGGVSAPKGTLIKDTTVDGNPHTTFPNNGITLPHGECLRCNLVNFDKSIVSNGGTPANPVLFDADYIHDITVNDGCSHHNGFYLNSSTYVTVDDSYVIMSGNNCVTGAISLQSDYGHPSHITIENSYGEGVGGMDFTGGCATNSTVRNNAFSSNNGYGGKDFSDYANSPGMVWTRNYVAETGAVLSSGGGC